jgi:polyribonucleotide nucleotidyltransferase
LIYDEVAQFLTEEKLEILYGTGKKDFHNHLLLFEEQVSIHLVENGKIDEEAVKNIKKEISAMVYKRVKKVMRKNILESGKRLDLRKIDEVRTIKCET